MVKTSVVKKIFIGGTLGRRGGSHQVIVGWQQAAVAPRLRLLGSSQRPFIALLVQSIYSRPDVRRTAHPL